MGIGRGFPRLSRLGDAKASLKFDETGDFDAGSCQVRFTSMNGHHQATSAGLKSADQFMRRKKGRRPLSDLRCPDFSVAPCDHRPY